MNTVSLSPASFCEGPLSSLYRSPRLPLFDPHASALHSLLLAATGEDIVGMAPESEEQERARKKGL